MSQSKTKLNGVIALILNYENLEFYKSLANLNKWCIEYLKLQAPNPTTRPIMLGWRLLWWECNNSVWTHISSLCQISLAIPHTNGSLIKQNNLQNHCCHKGYVLFIVNARVLFKYQLLPLVSSLKLQLTNQPSF
jgi:hypothetical protein